MKAYKGFNRDMVCRGFQYKEGGKYETDKAEVCEEGFHACENPLDCFAYYRPTEGALYHEVKLGGDIQRGDNDTKCAATKIKIGARLTLAGMIKAGVDFVFEKIKKLNAPAMTSGRCSTAATSGDRSTAATSGFCSTAATSGVYSTAVVSGDHSTAATSGGRSTAATSGFCSTAATSDDCSTAATSGDRSTAATSGAYSTAATSGDYSTAATSGSCSTAATSGFCSTVETSGGRSTAATSGDHSTAVASGYRTTAVASGDYSMAVATGEWSVAVATGLGSKARGSLGSWLVLTEREENGRIQSVKAICVDGKEHKPDTWYALLNGKVVEVPRWML